MTVTDLPSPELIQKVKFIGDTVFTHDTVVKAGFYQFGLTVDSDLSDCEDLGKRRVPRCYKVLGAWVTSPLNYEAVSREIIHKRRSIGHKYELYLRK